MTLIRAFVCSAALAVALTPFAALAADTTPEHAQAELANGQAQWDLAQQQAADMQQQANLSAANERMIALLRSESMRERQLSLVSNATAMEQIASALANAARSNGDLNARNELGIAQIKAAGLVAIADANLANGQQLAVTKGRYDELLNAQAQSNFMHQIANFISGQQAEQNMSNAKQIGQEQADAIHTPAIAQEQNGLAMGANELLASDVALAAGELGAHSVQISESAKASAVLGHASASLANAMAMASAAH
jgi:uncharacterized surface anchored protein